MRKQALVATRLITGPGVTWVIRMPGRELSAELSQSGDKSSVSVRGTGTPPGLGEEDADNVAPFASAIVTIHLEV
jgi:hypothetical protein